MNLLLHPGFMSVMLQEVTTPGEVTRVSWMDYPPEPPSTSSVYSDWLLNVPNPASRGSYENLLVEICRNLDYCLR